MNKKRAISIGLIAALSATSLTGCGSKIGLEAIPLVPPLSVKEVKDYYKESLSYDSIAKRTTTINEITYNAQEVPQAEAANVIKKAEEIEGILSRNILDESAEEQKLVSVFNYIKTYLDDKTLTKVSVDKVTQALGYYFVDINYQLSPRTSGSFNENLRYFGLNGAFNTDTAGNVVVDTAYLDNANRAVAAFKAANPDYQGVKSVASGVRRPITDVSLYNKAAGQSLTQTAPMPLLTQIYNIPAETGGVAGFGIYPQGAFTLRDFDYSRARMSGMATIRYVFKKGLMDPTNLEFKNAYVTSMELNTVPKTSETEVLAPSFIESNIQQLLERADRAICNSDLSALMSGKIFEDVGPAVVYGNIHRYVYNQKHMTKLVDIVGRDEEKNEYLISFEQTLQEAPKGVRAAGTYTDYGYMVINQVDTDFHITDYVVTKREMVKEPQINLDNTILRQLAAMNLTGEVTQESKDGIGELMTRYYTACTNRKLDAMYASYNSDVEILPSTRLEYLNAQIRGWLTKMGTNVPCEYTGVIVQWIGGSENQVEFITQELMNYSGRNSGQYMENYYLVSKYNDTWVIDDMKVVESKEVHDNELASIQNEIAAGRSFAVDNVDNELKADSEGRVANPNSNVQRQQQQQQQGEQQGQQQQGENGQPIDAQQGAQGNVQATDGFQDNANIQQPADSTPQGAGAEQPLEGEVHQTPEGQNAGSQNDTSSDYE